MRKKIIYCLLVVSLGTLGGLTGQIVGDYNTTQHNIQFNVLIEGVAETSYGLQYWTGSGVIVDKEGIIVSARHCVEGADFIRVTLQDGRAYIVYTWKMDDKRDIALFQIPSEFEEVAIIGNSNLLQKNDRVYNIGNSLGIWENKVIQCVVEKNDFKRLAFCTDGDFIFVVGEIRPGCSGGGVYYKNELIGIVSLGRENTAFLVPSEEVQRVLDEHKKVFF